MRPGTALARLQELGARWFPGTVVAVSTPGWRGGVGILGLPALAP